MLQVLPYPWRDIRGCSCRRFCEGVKRQGKFLWMQCPTATGLFAPFASPIVVPNALSAGDCDWITSFEIEQLGSNWLYSVRFSQNATGPFGSTNLTWGLNISVIREFPFLPPYAGSGGDSTFPYPQDCRETPDFTVLPDVWTPSPGAFPLTSFGGPFQTIYGWENHNPF